MKISVAVTFGCNGRVSKSVIRRNAGVAVGIIRACEAIWNQVWAVYACLVYFHVILRNTDA